MPRLAPLKARSEADSQPEIFSYGAQHLRAGARRARCRSRHPRHAARQPTAAKPRLPDFCCPARDPPQEAFSEREPCERGKRRSGAVDGKLTERATTTAGAANLSKGQIMASA